ncbi:glycosyltransferase family 1 protein [Cellulomonas sp. 73-145]|uniref:glycosyltransferase family 4 protein n=1 Tax=unclassified Cellulomonas TaxID=2620175 RepID=UPI000B01D181|nr:glycosyltransferase family 1 protein [Cellulomonas sp. 73-145]
MKMRVLVDATAIPPDRGGVGRYVEELLRALDALDVSLAAVVQPRDGERLAAAVPGAEIVVAPGAVARRPARMAWEQLGLPRVARRWRADVLHSPHYTMPVAAGVPVVVTLHDATFFSHPSLHSAVKGRFFRTATRWAVRHAAALVVPSAATGREVRRYAGGEVARFHVAHHGVDTAVFHPTDAVERDRVRATLDIADQPYVAFLGTLEPRKNVPALVRGWVAAVAGWQEPPALVLAGGPGWDEGVEPALAAVPDELTVRRPGYLPLADLAGFLGGAQVVAYPSLGEGFGLPVLEAMACGAAVLTSRELSLPEVGGEAVEYGGTTDEQIAAALRSLLERPERRSELGRAAQERAAGFTWDAAARVHLDAYRAALGS